MRKEIEQRPVDTKVLREAFRKALERNINKLMSEGYIPVGGISTHMNTHTRPILGIDSQEYTQTMVKYENFEVWTKETDAERGAYTDEHTSEHLQTQITNIKKAAEKDLKEKKKYEELLADAEAKPAVAKKSFFGKFAQSVRESQRQGRLTLVQKAKERLASHKKNLDEANKELAVVTDRLDHFYKTNPGITKDILMNSR
jgi:hypothetical protein